MTVRRGFTIAELIISIFIGLLLISTVSSIFILNQRTFRKSNIKAELTQNARIVVDLMSREIRQAKSIVTTLPADGSNPATVAHELKFEDGHITSHVQYVRYYLNGTILQRQILAYYFDTDPTTYVRWDDINQFGGPTEAVLEDRVIGENFSQVNFFGSQAITIELLLQKLKETIDMQSIIDPRNA